MSLKMVNSSVLLKKYIKNIDHSWHDEYATIVHHDLALFRLKRHINLHKYNILDIGCSKVSLQHG